jgi:hypothetical protein
MAAAASLTLKNAAASNVTFEVFAVREDSVEWVESGATSILGTTRAVLSRKIPTDRSAGVYRTAGKLTRPVVNETSGALDGVNTFTFECLHPAKLSTAEVDETFARGVAFVGQTVVKTAFESGAIPT